MADKINSAPGRASATTCGRRAGTMIGARRSGRLARAGGRVGGTFQKQSAVIANRLQRTR